MQSYHCYCDQSTKLLICSLVPEGSCWTRTLICLIRIVHWWWVVEHGEISSLVGLWYIWIRYLQWLRGMSPVISKSKAEKRLSIDKMGCNGPDLKCSGKTMH